MTPNSQIPHEQAVRFEAAQDVLRRLLGHAVGAIERERTAAVPDPTRIADWTTRRDDYAARLRRLDPRDHPAITVVLDHDSEELRAIGADTAPR